MERLGRAVSSLPKGIAALSSFVPLAFTFEQLYNRLSESQWKAVTNPLLVCSLAFGTGFAASSDIKATIYALVVLAILLSVYDDMLDKEESDKDVQPSSL